MSKSKPNKHPGSTDHDPTLCWDCALATRPWACPWVGKGNPVSGWMARETVVSKKSSPYASYHVLTCPKFKRDSHLGGMLDHEEVRHKVKLDDGSDVENLAEAIVQRAVEDWIALHYGSIPKLSKVDGSCVKRDEVIKFFYSAWCRELLESFTEYTPENLRRYLKIPDLNAERHGVHGS